MEEEITSVSQQSGSVMEVYASILKIPYVKENPESSARNFRGLLLFGERFLAFFVWRMLNP
jgi:hypothetical protein